MKLTNWIHAKMLVDYVKDTINTYSTEFVLQEYGSRFSLLIYR